MNTRSARTRRLTALGVGLLGAGASVLVAVLLQRAEARQHRADFERHAVEYALAIERELAEDVQAVETVARFFEAWGQVTREEFRRVTSHLLSRHGSLRALSWNPRVTHRERSAHETLVGRERPAYRITERAPEGALIRARHRDEYFVVCYIEPYTGNEAAVGFDVRSERRRRAALEHATVTGSVGLTSQILLVQEETPGFLAFWPIRAQPSARETSPGEKRFAGFAVGVFQVADLVSEALRLTGHPEFAIRIEDVTDPTSAGLLYRNHLDRTAVSAAESPLIEHVENFDYGGRTWRLRFAPGGGTALERSLVPAFALFGGLIITSLGTAYLLTLIRVNAGLEREIVLREGAERERRRLDRKLREAQKLESLGVLAGGIAHDFNNLLTAILGYTDQALKGVQAKTSPHKALERVHLAATRAAELTRQMLVYTGSDPVVPDVLDLSRLVKEMADLLDSSVSKKATLVCKFPQEPQELEGDPTQIRQIVMNLIVNASDALSDEHGEISVRTGTRNFDEKSLREAYLAESNEPGPRVFLEVSDTGCGMTPEERARVFDPFFSTKFTGRGLGLAAVLGIVRGHRGAIWVSSDLGTGTSFTVAFPVANRGRPTRPMLPTPEKAKRPEP